LDNALRPPVKRRREVADGLELALEVMARDVLRRNIAEKGRILGRGERRKLVELNEEATVGRIELSDVLRIGEIYAQPEIILIPGVGQTMLAHVGHERTLLVAVDQSSRCKANERKHPSDPTAESVVGEMLGHEEDMKREKK
jgi:hypothetical protein